MITQPNVDIPDLRSTRYPKPGRYASFGDPHGFLASMGPYRRAIDDALSDILASNGEESAGLATAMRYAVLGSGGKRLRPLLCLLSTESCGMDPLHAMTVACALELIHACSLIHDDLPAMDGDSLRRGQPTCHVKFGEGLTILAGDALLAKSFELIGTPIKGVKPELQLKIVHVLASGIGIAGMARGQALDIHFTGRASGQECLTDIPNLKTGEFIRISALSGAIIAGAARTELEAISCFGEHVGLAFQLVDDLLNEVGDSRLSGKPVGTDRSMGKPTYVSRVGIEGTRCLIDESLRNATEALRCFGEKANPLRELAMFIGSRQV